MRRVGLGAQAGMPVLLEGNGKTADGTLRSGAHLLGQVDYARGDHVKIFRLRFVWDADGTVAVFVGAMDETGAEAGAAGGLQIVDVGCAHHYFFGLQVEIIVS